jgi:hypothetical protein
MGHSHASFKSVLKCHGYLIPPWPPCLKSNPSPTPDPSALLPLLQHIAPYILTLSHWSLLFLIYCLSSLTQWQFKRQELCLACSLMDHKQVLRIRSGPWKLWSLLNESGHFQRGKKELWIFQGELRLCEMAGSKINSPDPRELWGARNSIVISGLSGKTPSPPSPSYCFLCCPPQASVYLSRGLLKGAGGGRATPNSHFLWTLSHCSSFRNFS